MRNAETQAAWEYHNATKHSPESVRRSRHFLDWSNQPRPYKLYAHLEGQPLPPPRVSAAPALPAIATVGMPRDQERVPDLQTLAAVLHFSAGITKRLRYPGGVMAFRAAACTGALYHIELYVITGPLHALEAGVYHYGVHDHALRRLRAGDYRGVLVEATGQEPAVGTAPTLVAYTSTFWRNAWKYQARAYRHSFWDSGTILANTLAVAAAHQLPARVVAGFVDATVNRLLDVDGEREAAIALVPLGYAPARRAGAAPPVDLLGLETVPVSPREVDYPLIRQMHAASALVRPDEVAAWRAAAPRLPRPAPAGPLIPLRPLEVLPQEPIETVIRRRGSTRRFAPTPITFEALSTVLAVATRGIEADFLPAPTAALTDLYLIVNAVEGLPSGTYVFHREQQALEQLAAGSFREEAGFLALAQQLGADAAVNVYFLADLAPILAALGNRGYRAAQLDASIAAGKLYLAAYALGLGATGLTFFDDLVTEFFAPHARGKSVMFLIALGQPAYGRSRQAG
ncbi:MAG TPA: SagB/ThcOx family dehydrogenase [Chloroflexota bacterium]|nr:SagB/ThcOx family dehydrogenase [Chloroflexota bacterium]